MAKTSIFYVNDSGRLVSLEVDAALSRESAQAVEVTRFPVEDGSVIADHAIRAPDAYRLEGMISGRPADGEIETAPESVSRERAQAIGAERTSSAVVISSEGRAKLEAILARKGLVAIVEANGRTLDDMIMTALNFPENGQGPLANATYFVAAFEKIATVKTATAPIPKTSKPAKTKGGKKPTEKASEPVARKKSAAKLLADTLRGRE